MMDIEIKKVKLSEIKLNPDNPRKIEKSKMDSLVKSLKEFPDMMDIREIVVDDTMTILGGNMRYQALKKTKAKECIAKIVTGLTEDQKKEFVIKDNSSFGEYDWGSLFNNWSDFPLDDWGVNLPDDWLVGDVEGIDPPELRDGDREPFQQMTFTLHDEQAEEINMAISKAKGEGGGDSSVNENSNGNALAFIAGKFNRG